MLVAEAKFRQESVNGISLSVLKSALQKYIRRRELDKGLTVVGYLSAFDENTPEGKRIRTNITNRFIVCVSEEVSICEPYLPEYMLHLYKEWMACRTDIEKSTGVWVQMFTILCKSRKCRLISDYKSVYDLHPSPDKNSVLYRTLLQECGLTEVVHYDLKGVTDVKRIEEIVRKLLKAKDEKSFAVLGFIFPPANGKTDHLWQMIANSCSSGTCRIQIDALQYFYKKMTHAERPIYMYHAILICLKEKELDYSVPHYRRDIEIVSVEDVRALAEAHDGVFDGYVLDRHTNRNYGKKNSATFATEGAFVVDEDTRFLKPEYRDFYIKLRSSG
jgi:hypothetical protein